MHLLLLAMHFVTSSGIHFTASHSHHSIHNIVKRTPLRTAQSLFSQCGHHFHHTFATWNMVETGKALKNDSPVTNWSTRHGGNKHLILTVTGEGHEN